MDELTLIVRWLIGGAIAVVVVVTVLVVVGLIARAVQGPQTYVITCDSGPYGSTGQYTYTSTLSPDDPDFMAACPSTGPRSVG